MEVSTPCVPGLPGTAENGGGVCRGFIRENGCARGMTSPEGMAGGGRGCPEQPYTVESARNRWNIISRKEGVLFFRPGGPKPLHRV